MPKKGGSTIPACPFGRISATIRRGRGFREIRQIRTPSIQGEARHPVDFGAYKRQTRNQKEEQKAKAESTVFVLNNLRLFKGAKLAKSVKSITQAKSFILQNYCRIGDLSCLFISLYDNITTHVHRGTRMLVRLQLTNFRSYQYENTLLLTTVSKQKSHEKHLYEAGALTLTKFVGIFGDNASGKSNILKAISFIKSLVGFNVIPFQNFSFFGHENEPTIIDIVFTLGETIYEYSISLRRGEGSLWPYELLDETLSVVGNAKERTKTLYSKSTGINKALASDDELMFLAPLVKIYQQSLLTAGPSLFLHYISSPEKGIPNAKLKKRFVEVQRYIRDEFLVLSSDSINFNYLRAKDLQKIEPYVCRFDPSIEKIEFEPVSEELYRQFIIEPVLHDIKVRLSELRKSTISLTINNNRQFFFSLREDGTLSCTTLAIHHRHIQHVFSFEDESEGTKRFIILMSFFVNHNDNKTFFVDELERSLHPDANKLTMEFFENETSGKQTQFVFTTHHSPYIRETLRNDEIYFCDKDIFGSTSLYPMTEYKLRTPVQAEKMFLSGGFRRVAKNPQDGRLVP